MKLYFYHTSHITTIQNHCLYEALFLSHFPYHHNIKSLFIWSFISITLPISSQYKITVYMKLYFYHTSHIITIQNHCLYEALFLSHFPYHHNTKSLFIWSFISITLPISQYKITVYMKLYFYHTSHIITIQNHCLYEALFLSHFPYHHNTKSLFIWCFISITLPISSQYKITVYMKLYFYHTSHIITIQNHCLYDALFLSHFPYHHNTKSLFIWCFISITLPISSQYKITVYMKLYFYHTSHITTIQNHCLYDALFLSHFPYHHNTKSLFIWCFISITLPISSQYKITVYMVLYFYHTSHIITIQNHCLYEALFLSHFPYHHNTKSLFIWSFISITLPISQYKITVYMKLYFYHTSHIITIQNHCLYDALFLSHFPYHHNTKSLFIWSFISITLPISSQYKITVYMMLYFYHTSHIITIQNHCLYEALFLSHFPYHHNTKSLFIWSFISITLPISSQYKITVYMKLYFYHTSHITTIQNHCLYEALFLSHFPYHHNTKSLFIWSFISITFPISPQYKITVYTKLYFYHTSHIITIQNHCLYEALFLSHFPYHHNTKSLFIWSFISITLPISSQYKITVYMKLYFYHTSHIITIQNHCLYEALFLSHFPYHHNTKSLFIWCFISITLPISSQYKITVYMKLYFYHTSHIITIQNHSLYDALFLSHFPYHHNTKSLFIWSFISITLPISSQYKITVYMKLYFYHTSHIITIQNHCLYEALFLSHFPYHHNTKSLFILFIWSFISITLPISPQYKITVYTKLYFYHTSHIITIQNHCLYEALFLSHFPIFCSGLKGRRPFWLLNPPSRGGS